MQQVVVLQLIQPSESGPSLLASMLSRMSISRFSPAIDNSQQNFEHTGFAGKARDHLANRGTLRIQELNRVDMVAAQIAGEELKIWGKDKGVMANRDDVVCDQRLATHAGLVRVAVTAPPAGLGDRDKLDLGHA